MSVDMTEYLRPSQLEFGTANGCEAIVPPPVRRWLQSHSNDEGRCLLTVDLENAFNQIDTSPASCGRSGRVAPGLTRYCDFCNSNDSFVFFGPMKILGKRKYNGATFWDRCTSPQDSILPSPSSAQWTCAGFYHARRNRLRFPRSHTGLPQHPSNKEWTTGGAN